MISVACSNYVCACNRSAHQTPCLCSQRHCACHNQRWIRWGLREDLRWDEGVSHQTRFHWHYFRSYMDRSETVTITYISNVLFLGSTSSRFTPAYYHVLPKMSATVEQTCDPAPSKDATPVPAQAVISPRQTGINTGD